MLDALKCLNSLSGISTTIFVVDSNDRVVGSLTDGDIRRSLVAGASLVDSVQDVMHRNFIAFRNGLVNIDDIRLARAKKITTVPLLDSYGRLAEIFDFSKYNSVLPLDAVLMAGGKGERLRPLTLDTPKPLLTIADKCIIDYNVEALAANNISNVFVTTNYLSHLIEQHFSQAVSGIKVRCIKEPKRLGTIGSLKLINQWEHDDILVMNADLLTSINLEDFYLCHSESDALLTIASVPYTVSVPYAIIQDVDCRVFGIKEKPTFNYFANAGIYILKRKCLEYIPRDDYFDATDLIDALIADGKKVNRFTISGTWIDIGSPDDFRQAQELIKQHRQLNF